MKSKKENRLLNLAGKLAKAEAARAKSGWPPACAGILHQPKRPTKKQCNMGSDETKICPLNHSIA